MRSAGFTLIEILVVMVILAILATVVVPRLMDAPDKARTTKAQQEISGIASALQLYRVDNGSYPSTEQNVEALIAKPGGEPAANNWKSGGYINKLPRDPWDRPYQYLSPGQHGDFDLYSLGADGKVGGDEMAKDVTNWE